MTTRAAVTQLTEKTWIPLGIVASLLLFTAGGTWTLSATIYNASQKLDNITYEMRDLKTQVDYKVNDINEDLLMRTRARWTYEMEQASWVEFERINRDKGLSIPDTQTIKKNRDL